MSTEESRLIANLRYHASAMSKTRHLKAQWHKDHRAKNGRDAMTPELEIARAIIAARVQAGLTQEEVARRMRTTQSAVARLETGNSLPTLKSLYRYAAATGTWPEIKLVSSSVSDTVSDAIELIA